MDTECLNHRLTADERRQFEQEGYLVVRGALPPAVVAAGAAAAERLYNEYGPASGHPAEYGQVIHHSKTGSMNLLDALGKDDRFLELLDWPTTIARVIDILGWHIQLYHSHLIVTPPLPAGHAPGRMGWHQDTDRLNRDLETSPRPRISLKVGFFFTSTSVPGRGNFHVIPGRHLQDTLDLPAEQEREHPEATPILADAGDAVFFDRRVWHAGGHNTSEVTRKVLFLGYSYRWLRPRDNMTVGRYLEGADPIRRQLLGAGPTGSHGYTSPADEDVPLKAWWAEHAGQEAVVA